jgi:hypothetical protein
LFARNESDELVRQLTQLKAPQEAIEWALESCSPVVEIWPENFDVFQLFLSLSSQWNWAATMSRLFRTGLKYESVEAIMRIEKIKNRSVVLHDIQIMEFAALSAMNGDKA